MTTAGPHLTPLPEYTVLALTSVVVVLALEQRVWRSGLLRTARYWISMTIVLSFQCLVDGLLTRLPEPIVAYDEAMTLGVRFPWDIPVEDFAFGWSMVTATLILWHRATRSPDAVAPSRPTSHHRDVPKELDR